MRGLLATQALRTSGLGLPTCHNMSGKQVINNTINDMGTYNVNNVSRFSVRDATGQIEYHVTHSKFLGSRPLRQQQ